MLSVRFLILSVFCLTTSVGLADDKVRAMLGKAAPQWKDLAGADGKLHSSSEYDGARATVVVFLCNHCPCAKSYQNRFIDFVKNYKSKGIQFVAFNSDSSETLDQMKQRAKESGFNFDYLKDNSQTVAKSLRAQTTPHVFILNAERKVVFSGAFDDDKSGQKVAKQYVRDAIEDILAGRSIKTDESKLCGCAITIAN